MPSSYVSLQYHLIFATKHREMLLDREMHSRLFAYIGGILEKQDSTLLAAGGMPDHIHLLAALSKTRSVSDALRDIKANSSGWIHDHFPAMQGFAWQTGYAAFTVSYSLIGSVRDYLAGQEEHHRLTTSREELIAFLVRHQIPYDPRYLDEGEFTG